MRIYMRQFASAHNHLFRHIVTLSCALIALVGSSVKQTPVSHFGTDLPLLVYICLSHLGSICSKLFLADSCKRGRSSLMTLSKQNIDKRLLCNLPLQPLGCCTVSVVDDCVHAVVALCSGETLLGKASQF